jgi:hypothetical protein
MKTKTKVKMNKQRLLIERVFGDNYRVRDAKQPLGVVVTHQDWVKGILYDPKNCARALASVRGLNLRGKAARLGVAILEQIAYVPVPDSKEPNGYVILRYRMHGKGHLKADEMKRSERKHLPPELVTFHPPSYSQQLNVRRARDRQRSADRRAAGLPSTPTPRRKNKRTKGRVFLTRAGRLFNHHQLLVSSR